MGIFVTKDPSKAAIKLTTSDPSKGFGAGFLFESLPEDQLTEEQKALRYRSGAMQPPQGMKDGGTVRGWGKARGGKACKVR